VSVATITGYLASAVIVGTGLIPLGARLLRHGARASVEAQPVKTHVALGVAAALLAFVHTLGAIPALGEPAAAEGGNAALFPAAAAFLVVVAHVGVGLRLREPKLRDRVKQRRIHGITATVLVCAVIAHIVLLRRHG
jgi:formate-dependent nitrite reductase membrane component NrfD